MQQSIEAFVSNMSAQLDAIDGGRKDSDPSSELPGLRRILYLLQSLRQTLDGEDPARRREATAALMAEFRLGMAAMAGSLAQAKPPASKEQVIPATRTGGFGEGEVVPFNRARRRSLAARSDAGPASQEQSFVGRIADLHFSKPSPNKSSPHKSSPKESDVREQIGAIADRRRDAKAALERQATATSGAQRKIVAEPLHPIGMAWRMLPGIIRNLEQQLGKSILFVTAGERIEVNRSLIDAIRVPLIYLTRNAADHGLEISQERLRGGKSPVGTIRISASRDADDVILELSDDGRGLDPVNVTKLAAAGFLAGEDAEDRARWEAMRSRPASAATEAAGTQMMLDRGIGLDAVRRHIEMAGGCISLRSQPGCGVTVVIRVPAFEVQMSSVSSSGEKQAVCLPNFPR